MTALFFVLLFPSLGFCDLSYDRACISKDEIWSGKVELTGKNVVKKGAVLTIIPGTTVRFVYTDTDGDGIGDGELTVEGRLVARGTKERPILFTSARREPAKKDWTFVMLSHAGGSVFEHCRFEYAFTGLQVHWTDAVVTDCVFTDNFEGMRFSVAVLDAEHNVFTGNTYGIRYESRGSKVKISHNRVTGNSCGFFPVTRSATGVVVEENDIMNEDQNVKVGDGQKDDVDYRNNFWGGTDPDKIKATMLDGRTDRELGKVVFEPFLTTPVAGAGVE